MTASVSVSCLRQAISLITPEPPRKQRQENRQSKAHKHKYPYGSLDRLEVVSLFKNERFDRDKVVSTIVEGCRYQKLMRFCAFSTLAGKPLRHPKSKSRPRSRAADRSVRSTRSQPRCLRALACGDSQGRCGSQFHAVPSFILRAIESLIG
jgi:hypothetical protein